MEQQHDEDEDTVNMRELVHELRLARREMQVLRERVDAQAAAVTASAPIADHEAWQQQQRQQDSPLLLSSRVEQLIEELQATKRDLAELKQQQSERLAADEQELLRVSAAAASDEVQSILTQTALSNNAAAVTVEMDHRRKAAMLLAKAGVVVDDVDSSSNNDDSNIDGHEDDESDCSSRYSSNDNSYDDDNASPHSSQGSDQDYSHSYSSSNHDDINANDLHDNAGSIYEADDDENDDTGGSLSQRVQSNGDSQSGSSSSSRSQQHNNSSYASGDDHSTNRSADQGTQAHDESDARQRAAMLLRRAGVAVNENSEHSYGSCSASSNRSGEWSHSQQSALPSQGSAYSDEESGSTASQRSGSSGVSASERSHSPRTSFHSVASDESCEMNGGSEASSANDAADDQTAASGNNNDDDADYIQVDSFDDEDEQFASGHDASNASNSLEGEASGSANMSYDGSGSQQNNLSGGFEYTEVSSEGVSDKSGSTGSDRSEPFKSERDLSSTNVLSVEETLPGTSLSSPETLRSPSQSAGDSDLRQRAALLLARAGMAAAPDEIAGDRGGSDYTETSYDANDSYTDETIHDDSEEAEPDVEDFDNTRLALNEVRLPDDVKLVARQGAEGLHGSETVVRGNDLVGSALTAEATGGVSVHSESSRAGSFDPDELLFMSDSDVASDDGIGSSNCEASVKQSRDSNRVIDDRLQSVLPAGRVNDDAASITTPDDERGFDTEAFAELDEPTAMEEATVDADDFLFMSDSERDANDNDSGSGSCSESRGGSDSHDFEGERAESLHNNEQSFVLLESLESPVPAGSGGFMESPRGLRETTPSSLSQRSFNFNQQNSQLGHQFTGPNHIGDPSLDQNASATSIQSVDRSISSPIRTLQEKPASAFLFDESELIQIPDSSSDEDSTSSPSTVRSRSGSCLDAATIATKIDSAGELPFAQGISMDQDFDKPPSEGMETNGATFHQAIDQLKDDAAVKSDCASHGLQLRSALWDESNSNHSHSYKGRFKKASQSQSFDNDAAQLPDAEKYSFSARNRESDADEVVCEQNNSKTSLGRGNSEGSLVASQATASPDNSGSDGEFDNDHGSLTASRLSNHVRVQDDANLVGSRRSQLETRTTNSCGDGRDDSFDASHSSFDMKASDGSVSPGNQSAIHTDDDYTSGSCQQNDVDSDFRGDNSSENFRLNDIGSHNSILDGSGDENCASMNETSGSSPDGEAITAANEHSERSEFEMRATRGDSSGSDLTEERSQSIEGALVSGKLQAGDDADASLDEFQAGDSSSGSVSRSQSGDDGEASHGEVEADDSASRSVSRNEHSQSSSDSTQGSNEADAQLGGSRSSHDEEASQSVSVNSQSEISLALEELKAEDNMSLSNSHSSQEEEAANSGDSQSGSDDYASQSTTSVKEQDDGSSSNEIDELESDNDQRDAMSADESSLSNGSIASASDSSDQMTGPAATSSLHDDRQIESLGDEEQLMADDEGSVTDGSYGKSLASAEQRSQLSASASISNATASEVEEESSGESSEGPLGAASVSRRDDSCQDQEEVQQSTFIDDDQSEMMLSLSNDQLMTMNNEEAERVGESSMNNVVASSSSCAVASERVGSYEDDHDVRTQANVPETIESALNADLINDNPLYKESFDERALAASAEWDESELQAQTLPQEPVGSTTPAAIETTEQEQSPTLLVDHDIDNDEAAAASAASSPFNRKSFTSRMMSSFGRLSSNLWKPLKPANDDKANDSATNDNEGAADDNDIINKTETVINSTADDDKDNLVGLEPLAASPVHDVTNEKLTPANRVNEAIEGAILFDHDEANLEAATSHDQEKTAAAVAADIVVESAKTNMSSSSSYESSSSSDASSDENKKKHRSFAAAAAPPRQGDESNSDSGSDSGDSESDQNDASDSDESSGSSHSRAAPSRGAAAAVEHDERDNDDESQQSSSSEESSQQSSLSEDGNNGDDSDAIDAPVKQQPLSNSSSSHGASESDDSSKESANDNSANDESEHDSQEDDSNSNSASSDASNATIMARMAAALAQGNVAANDDADDSDSKDESNDDESNASSASEASADNVSRQSNSQSESDSDNESAVVTAGDGDDDDSNHSNDDSEHSDDENDGSNGSSSRQSESLSSGSTGSGSSQSSERARNMSVVHEHGEHDDDESDVASGSNGTATLSLGNDNGDDESGDNNELVEHDHDDENEDDASNSESRNRTESNKHIAESLAEPDGKDSSNNDDHDATLSDVSSSHSSQSQDNLLQVADAPTLHLESAKDGSLSELSPDASSSSAKSESSSETTVSNPESFRHTDRSYTEASDIYSPATPLSQKVGAVRQDGYSDNDDEDVFAIAPKPRSKYSPTSAGSNSNSSSSKSNNQSSSPGGSGNDSGSSSGNSSDSSSIAQLPAGIAARDGAESVSSDYFEDSSAMLMTPSATDPLSTRASAELGELMSRTSTSKNLAAAPEGNDGSGSESSVGSNGNEANDDSLPILGGETTNADSDALMGSSQMDEAPLAVSASRATDSISDKRSGHDSESSKENNAIEKASTLPTSSTNDSGSDSDSAITINDDAESGSVSSDASSEIFVTPPRGSGKIDNQNDSEGSSSDDDVDVFETPPQNLEHVMTEANATFESSADTPVHELAVDLSFVNHLPVDQSESVFAANASDSNSVKSMGRFEERDVVVDDLDVPNFAPPLYVEATIAETENIQTSDDSNKTTINEVTDAKTALSWKQAQTVASNHISTNSPYKLANVAREEDTKTTIHNLSGQSDVLSLESADLAVIKAQTKAFERDGSNNNSSSSSDSLISAASEVTSVASADIAALQAQSKHLLLDAPHDVSSGSMEDTFHQSEASLHELPVKHEKLQFALATDIDNSVDDRPPVDNVASEDGVEISASSCRDESPLGARDSAVNLLHDNESNGISQLDTLTGTAQQVYSESVTHAAINERVENDIDEEEFIENYQLVQPSTPDKAPSAAMVEAMTDKGEVAVQLPVGENSQPTSPDAAAIANPLGGQGSSQFMSLNQTEKADATSAIKAELLNLLDQAKLQKIENRTGEAKKPALSKKMASPRRSPTRKPRRPPRVVMPILVGGEADDMSSLGGSPVAASRARAKVDDRHKDLDNSSESSGPHIAITAQATSSTPDNTEKQSPKPTSVAQQARWLRGLQQAIEQRMVTPSTRARSDDDEGLLDKAGIDMGAIKLVKESHLEQVGVQRPLEQVASKAEDQVIRTNSADLIDVFQDSRKTDHQFVIPEIDQIDQLHRNPFDGSIRQDAQVKGMLGRHIVPEIVVNAAPIMDKRTPQEGHRHLKESGDTVNPFTGPGEAFATADLLSDSKVNAEIEKLVSNAPQDDLWQALRKLLLTAADTKADAPQQMTNIPGNDLLSIKDESNESEKEDPELIELRLAIQRGAQQGTEDNDNEEGIDAPYLDDELDEIHDEQDEVNADEDESEVESENLDDVSSHVDRADLDQPAPELVQLFKAEGSESEFERVEHPWIPAGSDDANRLITNSKANAALVNTPPTMNDIEAGHAGDENEKWVNDYDPPRRSQNANNNRCICLLWCLVCCIILILLIVLPVTLTRRNRNAANENVGPTISPSIAPTLSPTLEFSPTTLTVPSISPANAIAPQPAPTLVATQLPTPTATTQQPTELSTVAPATNASWVLVGGPFLGDTDSSLGTSVSLSNPFMAAGARSGNGSVEIFQLDGASGQWTPFDVLIGEEQGSLFGSSLSLSRPATSSDVAPGLIIGAPATKAAFSSALVGAAFYYELNDNSSNNTLSWTQVGSILRGDEDSYANNEAFGFSVATSANRIIACGAPFSSALNINGRGRVYTFSYNENVQDWTPLSVYNVAGDAENAWLGSALDISSDGALLIAGGPGRNGGDGYAVVYAFGSNQRWQVLATFEAMANSLEAFGSSVKILDNGLGEMIAVGGPAYDSGRGVIRVYERQVSNGFYAQLGNDIVGDTTLDALGTAGTLTGSVATSSTGSIYVLASTSSGIVFRYEWLAGDWQRTIEPFDTGLDSLRALSMSQDGASFAAGGTNQVSLYNRNEA
ncbi:hypothetical protein MPSEU_001105500 [Mayamaea pseudoterrestris]|nr:hypothetical protein MPSEU_001105500 [Mayamaea pseudoterrestris]